MRIKFNGKWFKYKPKYDKRKDDFGVKLPSYSLYRYGEMLYGKEWKECRFYIFDIKNKFYVEIFLIGQTINNNDLNIGKISNQCFEDKIEISKFNRFLIRLYDFIFITKIRFLKILDKAENIRRNLFYILIALSASILYFFINYYCDNYLQDLINENIIIQSIIIFLSISSIINIIHPFTLRKEWTIKEIDNLIENKIKKNKIDSEKDKLKDKYR
jgi:hypothetical protein